MVPIVGSPSERETLLMERLDRGDVDCFVVSASLWEWLAKLCIEKKMIFWDWLILDESHLYKNTTSNRNYYAKTAGWSSYKVTLLTGTPNSKGYHNLYGQMSIMSDDDESNVFGKSYDHFLSRFFYVDRENHFTVVRGNEQKREIEKLCKGKFFRYDAKDHLPEIITHDKIIWFQMTKMARTFYDLIERDYTATFSGQDVFAESDVSRNSKLSQIASGRVIDTEGNSIAIHDQKIEAIKDLVDTGQNILIAYFYKADRESLLKKIKGSIWFKGSEKHKKNWNDNPDTGLIYVCNPASVSTGINLQYGGSVAVFYSLPRGKRDDYDQFRARIARQGQENEVFFYTLLCRDTIDEKDYRNLMADGAQQQVFLDEIKENQRK